MASHLTASAPSHGTQAFALTVADGCVLRGLIEGLRADGPRPHALLLLVHGLGEHQGRYAHVRRHFVARGLAVASYDQRGHGQSDGARGRLASDDALLADLGQVMDHLRQQPGMAALPWVLLGHSMGGLVAARHQAEALAPRPAPWWRAVDALVLSSPALDVGMRAWQRGLVGLLAPRWPNLALGNGLNPAWVSRDPEVVRAYRSDPLVHDRISTRLARFFLDAGGVVQAAAPRWPLPTLLAYAGADRCVRPEGSRAFAAHAPADRVQAIAYPGAAHEILNEPEQAQVLADIDHWLGARLGLPPQSTPYPPPMTRSI